MTLEVSLVVMLVLVSITAIAISFRLSHVRMMLKIAKVENTLNRTYIEYLEGENAHFRSSYEDCVTMSINLHDELTKREARNADNIESG